MKDFMGLLVDISCSCRLLLLLAASLPLPTTHSLLSPDGEGLSCLSDFDNKISCVWNSTRSAQHADITAATSCKLNAHKNYSTVLLCFRKLRLSCNLMPLDHSDPAIRACTLVSPEPEVTLKLLTTQLFLPSETWYIFLVCDSVKETKITYMPDKHSKYQA
ncbi:hypothetical protein N1851_030622 [Merluccius polli]|uniref:Interleukin-2 receptor subunit beta N-terminal domain-containing protein n=1 Tax=Merluccius polli TaxID=89951 RepID=A0AA47M562_MERPO|nr:hypothetical protein N1851_030622 [Merluccius polli]